MKSLTVFLMGGLGNVLFQLNAAAHLEQKGYKIKYDFSMLRRNPMTQLIGWSIHGTDSELNLLGIKEQSNSLRFFHIALLWASKKLNRAILGCRFTNDLMTPKENIKYIAGYFQENIEINEKFLKTIKTKIQEITHENIIESQKYDLVIHYRSGDYKRYGIKVLDNEFYNQIMPKYKNILVVTNDIDQAKKIFKNTIALPKITIHRGSSAINDFLILLNARNLVIANSTFSWWAAELSDADKIYEPNWIRDSVEWSPNSNKYRIKI